MDKGRAGQSSNKRPTTTPRPSEFLCGQLKIIFLQEI